MSNMLRGVLTAGALALSGFAGLTAAKADVIRIFIAVAANAADHEDNAALLPTGAALLKKGTGNKAVYVGTDAAKMTVSTISVWANEADISTVTNSADWKAMSAKHKYKTVTVQVFQMVP